jgi:hypothetical protein
MGGNTWSSSVSADARSTSKVSNPRGTPVSGVRKSSMSKKQAQRAEKVTWLYISNDVYQESKRIMKAQGYAVMRKMGQILQEQLVWYNSMYGKKPD